MENIKDITNKAKGGWNKLDASKKKIMVVTVIGIILIAIFTTYYSNKIEYKALFTNLELADAGRIANDLETKNIKYRLENNGRDILVDKDILDEYRIGLAMEGMMPQNSTGFEIFDDMGLMVTDEDRKIMYERALTGELQRSIMSLDAVSTAKVHLMIPEQTIFVDQVGEPSASVILDIKEYESVTDNMITGIASLISGAVDNMKMENIQIIDSRGNLLSASLQRNDDVTSLTMVNHYSGLKEDFESKVEANILELLGSAYGWDKVKVSVFADLDFDAEESTTITYSNPIPRSEHIDASGGNIDVQQVTGGNLDDNISSVVESQGDDTSSLSRTINNELSTETTTSVKAPGKVERISTSVIYDGNLLAADIGKVENIVAAATGFDADRGDIINVESIVFNRPEENQGNESIVPEFNIGQFIQDNLANILRGLGILAVIILTILIIRRQIREKKKDKLLQEEIVRKASSQASSKLADAFDESIEIKADHKEIQAQNYAKENPDVAADLIKAWLKD